MARFYVTPPPMNPVARILASLFAVLLIVGAVIFGFFVLVGGVALGLLGWIVLSLRGWWLRKKGVEFPQDPAPDQSSNSRDTIEAEYTVISRRRD